MGIIRYWLVGAVGTVALTGGLICSMPGRLTSAAVQFGRLGSRTPSYVHAGVPFVVHDETGVQLCVSSRAGRPLAPYMLPMPTARYLTPRRLGQTVHAGIPVVLHDGYATLVCVSSYAGVSLSPFISR